MESLKEKQRNILYDNIRVYGRYNKYNTFPMVNKLSLYVTQQAITDEVLNDSLQCRFMESFSSHIANGNSMTFN